MNGESAPQILGSLSLPDGERKHRVAVDVIPKKYLVAESTPDIDYGIKR